MLSTELQVSFFKKIKEIVPPHVALVDDIAELLNISNDSAYRRIRGEKPLAFDEIQILAAHYEISLDQFLRLKTNNFVLSGNLVSLEKFEMGKYLHGIADLMTSFSDSQKKEMFLLNKDIPIFHNFMFPELAAFKCYFWSRYNFNYPEYNKGQFLISDFIDLFEDAGKTIADLYLEVPSTEIWNLNCINTTLMQICYYRDSKVIKSGEDVETLFNCLVKLVNHVEQQAEYGAKFPYQKPDAAGKSKFRVFVNEFIVGDNTILMENDNQRMVSLNHNNINYAYSTDTLLTDYSWKIMDILIKKSTLISETGEKDRQIFFDTLRQRIEERR